jgi:hypothetical protein
MSAPVIRPGLKFTSVHFSAIAEVHAVSEQLNTVDVILTPSDGHSWIEKGWNLQHMQWGFERKEYEAIKPNNVNISII